MKSIFLTTSCILFVLLFSSCKEKKEKNDSLLSVDIEANLKNMDVINLSQFNAEIHYVPLKTEKNLEISRIWHIDVTPDLLLVSNNNLCLLYDYSGTLITKIGENGKVTNEYNGIFNIGFGFNKNIYIQSSSNFLEFKTDGSFINSFDLNKEKNPNFYMESWTSINDSLFLGQIPNSSGHEENKAILFDKNGNLKHGFKNYISLNRPSLTISSFDGEAIFYCYKSKIHFKEKMNDTLFCLTDKYELRPIISFNIGKYEVPKEYRERPASKGSNPLGYVFLNNVFETSKFVFLSCNFGHNIPAPMKVSGQKQWYENSEPWYYTTNTLGLYSRDNKSLAFCKPTSTGNPLFTTGFYNDIDAGPRFFPAKQVNDSTLVMWIEAKDLKYHVASDDFKKNIPKYPEKKKELEELANKLTDFDNPVLMFVTFKNK